MNKRELVKEIATKANVAHTNASAVIDAMCMVVVEALSKEDRVVIAGFGIFEMQKRAARMGRNPQTGEKIQIKERSIPRFKCGKTLKAAVA